MLKKSIYIVFFFHSIYSFSQSTSTEINSDTIPLMTTVIIKGFESDRRLLETPVSAGLISRNDIHRFSEVSLLPAMNMVPGVSMEERSPGSYRLSLRGSLLRSPFGVRNLKVYWNDIPFTDAGGNTYFNLIDQHSVSQIEILKGPGGSMYGANTGGVIILHPDEPSFLEKPDAGEHHFRAQISAGSYGLFSENVQWKFQDKRISSGVTQSHLQSNGYRQNAGMRRDVIQWNGSARLSETNKLDWILMYADIFYQTPGGLNIEQMKDDPRQARPATPGAVDQKAAIYNKTPFGGLSNRYQISKQWSNVTSVMFAYSDFKNPFITNFETRKETNTGIRTKMVYHTNTGIHDLKFTAGVEWLYNYSAINNYGNREGKADTIQFKDKVWARQVSPFIQGEWQVADKFQIQAGAGSNFFLYRYKRLTDPDDSEKSRKLKNQLLPRVAVLYRIAEQVSLYSSLSKGFSPPSIAEVRPSEGSFYAQLQPEYGWNREVGVRGSVWANRLYFDITAFQFRLHDAIVRRINAADAEYFVNSGGTNQKGIETFAEYTLVRYNHTFIKSAKLRTGITLNEFSFEDYIVNDKDYSGNSLTGVARTTWSGGLDLTTRWGLYLNASLTHTSKLPLNDANTFYSRSYDILLGRLGWKKRYDLITIEFFTGVDNALNQLYSLGNDINAFGNRFFNPAATRNYYGGLNVLF